MMPRRGVDPERVRRLVWKAGWWNAQRAVRASSGLLLVLVGAVVVMGSRLGRLPERAVLGGLPLVGVGGVLLLSVTLVDAYPTSFVRNPVPRTEEILARAQSLYQTHCAACHGMDGRGDGPLAAGLNPRPADLTDPHIPYHFDGELFWWISKGIPGSAMPAWEQTLSEEDRWALVHYIRTLRAVRTRSGS